MRLAGVWLVATREARERLRTRSFAISTAVVVLLAVGGIAAQQVIPDLTEVDPERLAVTGETSSALPGAIEATARQVDVDVEVVFYEDAPAAEEALDSGEVDAVLVDGERLLFQDAESRDDHETLAAIANQAVRSLRLPARLDALGLSAAEAQSLLQPEPLPEQLLTPATDGLAEPEDGAQFAGFISVLALFMALNFYGTSILMGVVEEKTTRVVEVLLGALRPHALLAGKVLGILAIGMLQFAIGAVAALVAAVVLGTAGVPSVAGEVAAYSALWFVLGLIFYAFVFATAGATVSRQEDAGNVTIPISLVLTGSYLVTAFVVLGDPDGTAAVVMSLIPFTAPLTMPPRIAAGDPALWQIGASVALMLLGIAGIIWLSGRIYTGAILRSGRRVNLLEAWRSAREARGA